MVENTTGKATHSYTSAGTYNAKVTVFDAENQSASKNVQITVQAKVCEGNFTIDGEDTAGDIAKVKDCNEIKGSLEIYNTDLTNLAPLLNLNKVTSNLSIGCSTFDPTKNCISQNDKKLASLQGLNNLTVIGGNLLIIHSSALPNFNGLNALTSIGGGLRISDNAALTSLSGLNNLKTLGGDLYIANNSTLTNLNGLNNVTSLGQYLHIVSNTSLTNLAGLDNLASVNGYLFIVDNAVLTSLSGLENLKEVKGNRKEILSNPKFDCSPYNQNPPPYFPLTQSTGNKVNCTTQ